MKRFGYLLEKISDKNNIRKAILVSSLGKRDKAIVKQVLSNIDFYIDDIYEILISESFENHYLEPIMIYEKMSKKWRPLHRPLYYPDQIIQWCCILVLEPIFRLGMDYHCVASVKGRGNKHIQDHLIPVIKYDRKNTRWVWKYDIYHFYESIDQDILIHKLEHKIKDKKCINLLAKFIRFLPKGLCLGSPINVWLANFYLQKHDHYLREKLHVKHMFRYADDVVVLGSNKRKLIKDDESIRRFLKDEELKLHDDINIWKFDDHPIDFVGFVYFRNFKVIIRKRIWRNIRRCLLRIKVHRDKLTSKLKRRFASYWGYIKNSNSYLILNKYCNEIRDLFSFVDKYLTRLNVKAVNL